MALATLISNRNRGVREQLCATAHRKSAGKGITRSRYRCCNARTHGRVPRWDQRRVLQLCHRWKCLCNLHDSRGLTLRAYTITSSWIRPRHQLFFLLFPRCRFDNRALTALRRCFIFTREEFFSFFSFLKTIAREILRFVKLFFLFFCEM